MKTALRALLIAPESNMISSVIMGLKLISIREGHRDYVVGQPILIGCPTANWAVMADCTEVTHCQLRDVSLDDIFDDGFSSREEALLGLQQFYPKLNMDSDVTVLKWNNVRGALSGK